MPDIIKIVKTVYKLEAKAAEAGVQRLKRRMGALARTADKVSGKIGGMARMLAAPAGLGLAGATGLVKHLVDVGRNAEDAQLSLTEMLQAVSRSSNLNLSGYERASAVAEKLREQFMALARDSPLNASQISDAFMKMTFSLSQAGLSLQQQVELARDVAVADLSSLVKGTAAADVKQILTGTATMKQITTQALQGIKGEAIKLAKKGKVQEAAKLIAQAVALDPKALAARGKSATGILESFGDQLLKVKQKIAKPVLEFLVAKVTEWGDWLDKNQEKVAEIAKGIGEGIVKAVKAVIDGVRWIGSHWREILAVVKVLAGVWIGAKLVKGISVLISLGGQFAAVMRSAAAAAAAGVGAMGGKGGKGSVLGKLAKGAGAVGLAVTAAEVGTDVGEGLASLFVGSKGNRAVEALEEFKAQSMTKDEYNAYVRSLEARRAKKPGEQKLEDDALKAQIDPTKVKGGGGGGRRQKVDKMEVSRFEVRDRDFARTSTRYLTGVRRESRAIRQIAGLGLGAGAIGVGVQ